MTVVVDYDDGITLGGMELATARQLDSLGQDVRQSSATAEAAARTAGQSAATASTDADNAANICHQCSQLCHGGPAGSGGHTSSR